MYEAGRKGTSYFSICCCCHLHSKYLFVTRLSVCPFIEFSCSLHTAKHLRGRFFYLISFSSRPCRCAIVHVHASITITLQSHPPYLSTRCKPGMKCARNSSSSPSSRTCGSLQCTLISLIPPLALYSNSV